MNRLIKIICLLIASISQLSAQTEFKDVYYEKDASMYSQSYVFVKQDSSSSIGTFTHIFLPDHEGKSIGIGSFIETNRFYILNYHQQSIKDTLIYSNNKQHQDTLYINWQNLWGEYQEDFSVVIYDTISGKTSYYTNLNPVPWTIRIPIENYELNGKRVMIKPLFSSHEFELKIPSEVNEININKNKETERIIYFEKKVRLKKINESSIKTKTKKVFIKE